MSRTTVDGTNYVTSRESYRRDSCESRDPFNTGGNPLLIPKTFNSVTLLWNFSLHGGGRSKISLISRSIIKLVIWHPIRKLHHYSNLFSSFPAELLLIFKWEVCISLFNPLHYWTDCENSIRPEVQSLNHNVNEKVCFLSDVSLSLR